MRNLVREDYSPYGTCWDYFPHEHARSRAYRWGEDGLLGFADRECRLCFALAVWNLPTRAFSSAIATSMFRLNMRKPDQRIY